MCSLTADQYLKFGGIHSWAFEVMAVHFGGAAGMHFTQNCQHTKCRHYMSDSKTFQRCKHGTDLLGYRALSGRGVRCLSVCFSVILLNVKDRQREIAVKPLEPINDFNTVVVVHPHLILPLRR